MSTPEKKELAGLLREMKRREHLRTPAYDPLKGQGFVLYHLGHHGQMNPGDLTKALGLTTPRTSAILRTLEEAGMIMRTADPADRRRVLVCLTEKGQAYVRAHDTQEAHDLDAVYELLGNEDAGTLVRLLKTLVDGGFPHSSESALP